MGGRRKQVMPGKLEKNERRGAPSPRAFELFACRSVRQRTVNRIALRAGIAASHHPVLSCFYRGDVRVCR